ncbi:MAG TPA: pyrimidine 5'-nucleotidase [Afifellaceae bacterium]|nr:pyrimidine 5'-nucleotidase [Afifellaceae bacterium]
MNEHTPAMLNHHPPEDLAVFEKVSAWIFDLDNTLYPRHSNLFAQIDDKIRAYVRDLLKVSPEDAQDIQKNYYKTYGTTLAGLMREHDIDPDDFLEFVHDIDHSPVQPDPALGAAIARLPGRKFIFTNGSRMHAEKVAARLGVGDHFEDIFDIAAANLVPKPERDTYQRFVNRFDVLPQNAAMFEDLARNLEVPKAIGMRTVLIVPQVLGAETGREVLQQAWEAEGQDAAHVDFITDDLATFVSAVGDVVAPA